MHTLLNTLHSYNRYLILAALVYVLFRAWSGWMGKKPFEKADNSASLILMILVDVQLLLGLIQYFVTSAFTTETLTPEHPLYAMARYFKMEHITGMILAIVLIHLGRSMAKKATTDEAKHKKLAIYTTVAAVFIIGMLAMKGLLFGTLASASAQ